MHELSIMENALAVVLEAARQDGANRVLLIRLRVGALSGVVPEALQFAFSALAPGTAADGAELAIEQVPARFWCAVCGTEFESPEMLAECPKCHTPSAELRSGRELQVASMEIE